MNNSYIILAYLIYLPIALVLTWVVAHNLFKSGLIFMRDIFFGREDIAKATNSLFKVGFYLLNIGFALYILRIYNALTGMQDTIEVLSSKIGGFSIYLGVMLFFNLYLFFRGKRVAKQRHSATVTSNQLAPQ
jgi:predicted PurR-regulated permease PerM